MSGQNSRNVISARRECDARVTRIAERTPSRLLFLQERVGPGGRLFKCAKLWIHGRNRLDWRERIMLDVWYVDHWSLALDFRILARAFVLLFRREGVYFDEEAAARGFLAKMATADQLTSPPALTLRGRADR